MAAEGSSPRTEDVPTSLHTARVPTNKRAAKAYWYQFVDVLSPGKQRRKSRASHTKIPKRSSPQPQLVVSSSDSEFPVSWHERNRARLATSQQDADEQPRQLRRSSRLKKVAPKAYVAPGTEDSGCDLHDLDYKQGYIMRLEYVHQHFGIVCTQYQG